MTKSAKTYELEEIITLAAARPDRIGCPEVTLDDYGIVDFISMDIGGARTVRCYELKISKSDFLSDAKKSFIGDFNYYVIPTELWESVKGHVEKGVGVWVIDKHGRVSVKKKATRQECKMDRSRIMGKIMRALNRENLKHCEQMWRQRQLDKKVADLVGAELDVGDAVEYRGREYVIDSIDYQRDQMSLIPFLSLVPEGSEPGERPEDELDGVRPSIVRKARFSSL